MRRYLTRKLVTYVLAFFVGVTVDWLIPRLVPGDPVAVYVDKFSTLAPGSWTALYKTFAKAFGLNVPLWQQYWNYWDNILHGNLGVSIYAYPATVRSVILSAVPYTLALVGAGDTVELCPRQPDRGGGSPAQVARQHRPADRLHLPGLALPLVGAGGGVLPGRGGPLVPHLRRVLGEPGPHAGAGASWPAWPTTGSCLS